jgi:predicted porin
MKKTIIAASIAAVVAAPAAFADVSISGMINYELADEAASKESAGSEEGALGSTHTDLVFKGSEDLGNGLKASWKYHAMADDGSATVADTSVAVSGDFGTVVAGRMETFEESKAAAFLSLDASHDLDVEDNRLNIARANSAVAYVSPSFNGLTIGVAGATSSASGNSSDDFDVVNYHVAYSNAGLTVFADQIEQRGCAASTCTASNTKTREKTTFGVGYKMGDLEVRVAQATSKNKDFTGSDKDLTATGFAVKYTMGANAVAVTSNDIEDDANTSKDDNYRDTVMSVAHSLSKRTSVYIARKNTDQSGKEDQTLVGIKHTF